MLQEEKWSQSFNNVAFLGGGGGGVGEELQGNVYELIVQRCVR